MIWGSGGSPLLRAQPEAEDAGDGLPRAAAEGTRLAVGLQPLPEVARHQRLLLLAVREQRRAAAAPGSSPITWPSASAAREARRCRSGFQGRPESRRRGGPTGIPRDSGARPSPSARPACRGSAGARRRGAAGHACHSGSARKVTPIRVRRSASAFAACAPHGALHGASRRARLARPSGLRSQRQRSRCRRDGRSRENANAASIRFSTCFPSPSTCRSRPTARGRSNRRPRCPTRPRRDPCRALPTSPRHPRRPTRVHQMGGAASGRDTRCIRRHRSAPARRRSARSEPRSDGARMFPQSALRAAPPGGECLGAVPRPLRPSSDG